ncbi:hypothetical protein [Thermococcus nautili]|uniref:hypothetical protein n=1 Tax=Thermococcus nautili TaxID=195522 RepID=UPI002554AC5B|nr:hypothetical protein [Thermococcus nautili]
MVHVETVVSTDVSDTKFVNSFTRPYQYQEEFTVKGLLFKRERLIGVYTPDYQLIPVNVELPWRLQKALFKARIRVKELKGVIKVFRGYRESKVVVYLMELKSKKTWRIHETDWVVSDEPGEGITQTESIYSGH